MKIEQDFEIDGMRFTALIDSRTLETHSRMQSLDEIQINLARKHLIEVIMRVNNWIRANEQLGRTNS